MTRMEAKVVIAHVKDAAVKAEAAVEKGWNLAKPRIVMAERKAADAAKWAWGKAKPKVVDFEHGLGDALGKMAIKLKAAKAQ